MKRIFTFLMLLSIGFAAHAQMRYLKGSLLGSNEVPATSSTASGVVIVKYNIATIAN